MPIRDTAWPAGTPCWIDYAAHDIEATKQFYAGLLGWTWEGGDPGSGGYLNAEKDGRRVAGLGPVMGEDQPSWTTYFATEDAAATAGRIRDAGGTVVVEPMDVGPSGVFAIALDPQGHPFGLWQAREHTGVQRFNEPGSLVWNEAAVADPEAARTFYTAVFGFAWDVMEGMPPYATFRTDDRPLGGLGRVEPGLPAGWTVCFAVASTDDAVAGVEAQGGRVLHPAEDTEFGRFAVVADPWGAQFSVMQVPAEG
jgi:predicted enzyme related to lactoylglutathione lyase